jgi:pimeloyl-ACP methyl ester carboxylesterase
MPEARSNGISIDYTDSGKDEPALLFMPGWCATREAFGKMADLCAAHRRVLALDWRGHGASGTPTGDFGEEGLVSDAVAVIKASGAEQVIPVALSHSGWVAIELRRKLEATVPKIVLIDWIVLDPPTPFLSALRGLQDPNQWEETRNRLFATWLQGVANPAVSQFVQFGMGQFAFDMWARAGREISAAYARSGNPLRALASLAPPIPILHVYAQPSDPLYWQSQQFFAESHSWFTPQRINALSHFPMLEAPEEMVEAIESFVATPQKEQPAGA